jgi:hypothetical protein
MKKYILLFIFTFFVSQMLWAQKENHRERRDQVKALKTAFITTELSLDPSEAEKFWPIYNVYDDNNYKIRHLDFRQIMKKINTQDLASLSDKEAQQILKEIISLEEALLENKKALIAKMKNIIGLQRTLLLLKTEEAFHRKMLRQYRARGND